MENHPAVQAAVEGARMDMLWVLIGCLVAVSLLLWLMDRSSARSEQTWTVLAKGTVFDAVVSPMPHLGDVPDESYPGTKALQTIVTFTDGTRIALHGDYSADLETGAYFIISQNGFCRLRIDRPGTERVTAYRD